MTFHFNFPFLLTSFLFFVFPSRPPLLATASSDRPPLCSNRFINARKLTNCSGLDFWRVPDRRSRVYGDTIVLYLGRNRFRELKARGFRLLPFLQQLDLSHNRIGNVSSEAFAGLGNLDTLDLSSNRLTDVPSRAFTELQFLKSLNLRGNPLRLVRRNAFANTPRLAILDLGDCRIADVYPPAFAALSNLQELSLHGNLLQTLAEKTLGKVPLTGKMRLLTLYRNPWHCDCRLQWLKAFVESENVTFNGPETTRCATPKRLKETAWTSLENRRFACPPALYDTPPRSDYVVDEFDQHNVTCRMTMNPAVQIIWYMNGKKLSTSNKLSWKSGRNATSSNIYSIHESKDEKNPNLITSVLRISSVTNATAGEFKCRAKNVAGVIEMTKTLSVRRRNYGVVSDEQKANNFPSGTLTPTVDIDGGIVVADDDAASSTTTSKNKRRPNLLNGNVIMGGVITGVVLVGFFLISGAFVFCATKSNNFKLNRNGSSDSVVFRQYGAPEMRISKAVTAKKRNSISTDLDAPDGGVPKRDETANLLSTCGSGGGGGLSRCVSATYIPADEDADEYQRPMAPVDAYPTASIHAALIRDIPRSQSVPSDWVDPYPPISCSTATVLHPLGGELDYAIPTSNISLSIADGIGAPPPMEIFAAAADRRDASPMFSIAELPIVDESTSNPVVSMYALTGYSPSMDTVTSMVESDTSPPALIVSVGTPMEFGVESELRVVVPEGNFSCCGDPSTAPVDTEV